MLVLMTMEHPFCLISKVIGASQIPDKRKFTGLIPASVHADGSERYGRGQRERSTREGPERWKIQERTITALVLGLGLGSQVSLAQMIPQRPPKIQHKPTQTLDVNFGTPWLYFTRISTVTHNNVLKLYAKFQGDIF